MDSHLSLSSPSGDFRAEIRLLGGCPVYAVRFKGRVVIAESPIRMAFRGGPQWSWQITGHAEREFSETWRPVYGERDTIRDHYRELLIELGEVGNVERRLNLVFRAYDAGIAFCYQFPDQAGWETAEIEAEHTEFRLAEDHLAWQTYTAQGEYAMMHVSQIEPGCERPLVLEVGDDLYIALGEARLVDFARMKFASILGAPGVVSHLDGPVSLSLPFTTPWRVIMAAETPGRLLENNDLFLNLNEPCALSDTSWIKPGKVLREITLTTTGGKACIQFCAEMNIQYILLDAGWYGAEFNESSDATEVSLDSQRPLDLHEIIRFGNELGVGIILYVNQIALAKQLDEILPLYQKWGVKGVKYGFVHVGSQEWTRWLHTAIRKAADHRLLVNVHDEYRPTGYSRTYPNLMTVEGVRGDEESDRENWQSMVTLFSRFLAGPADNTICYYAKRVDELCTHAYQLAKAVCFYSPWQHIFWYDKPTVASEKAGGVGGSKLSIGDEPELDFFARCPTVWNETRVLAGQIGQFAILARRSGSDWFVGVMNSGQLREFDIPLEFLTPGTEYLAHLYTDDPAMTNRTKVAIEQRSVDARAVLHVLVSAQGGVAIRICPS